MNSREERRKYEGDVWYEVWRRGGDPDRVNDDRVDNNYYNGIDADSAARIELQHQRPRHEQYPEQQFEEQYPKEEAHDE